MNIIIIQENGRHEENRSFRECFSLQRAFLHHGVSADVWGLGHDNYENVPVWDDYDLIINLENYDTTGWVPNLSNAKAVKYLWAIDAHVKGVRSYISTALDGGYDLILQATRDYVQFFRNSVWFPNCYDDSLIYPMSQTPRHEVGFCGNINNRGRLIEIMKNKFDFKLDEFIIGPSMVAAINSYKIHWNANIGIDVNYRNFETMGCNVALLTSYNESYDALGMVDGKTCFVYDTVEGMVAKAQKILENEDLRLEVASNGHTIVKQYHTYKNRAQYILELFDEHYVHTPSRRTV